MKPTALETDAECTRERERWKQIVFFLIRWTFRTWMACVALVALFTVLWILEALDVITGDTLGAIWISIIAVGIAFMALLIPVFFVTRRE